MKQTILASTLMSVEMELMIVKRDTFAIIISRLSLAKSVQSVTSRIVHVARQTTIWLSEVEIVAVETWTIASTSMNAPTE